MIELNNRDMPYVVGRLAALLDVAHDASNNEYARINKSLMAQEPSETLGVALTHIHMCRLGDSAKSELESIMAMMPADGLPKRLNTADQGQMWIGYYHEMKRIEDTMMVCKTTVTEHHAAHVEACCNNEISDLKRE